jgi:hypothetical protein
MNVQFLSIDGTSNRYRIFSQILDSMDFWLAKFLAYSFHLAFCLSFRSVHALSYVIAYFLSFLLAEPSLSYLHRCNYSDMYCPVIEVSYFKGTHQSGLQ